MSDPGLPSTGRSLLPCFIKQHATRRRQAKYDPTTFDIAMCMWYTGIDPFSGHAVPIARNLRDRKFQRALMQFFKPENYFLVRDALAAAGRADLIGGCDGLIPAHPPREAIEARRCDADHYHAVANPATGEPPGERGAGPAKPTGYRPGRNTQKRRQDKGKGKSGPSA